MSSVLASHREQESYSIKLGANLSVVGRLTSARSEPVTSVSRESSCSVCVSWGRVFASTTSAQQDVSQGVHRKRPRVSGKGSDAGENCLASCRSVHRKMPSRSIRRVSPCPYMATCPERAARLRYLVLSGLGIQVRSQPHIKKETGSDKMSKS